MSQDALFWLIIYILAAWRLAAILVSENSPFELIARFRGWLGPYDKTYAYMEQAADDPDGEALVKTHYGKATIRNSLAGIFSCVYCMSVWTGLGASAIWYYREGLPDTLIAMLDVLAMGFAISAAAIILHKRVNTWR